MLRTLAARHSSARQPSVRIGKRMVTKGKRKRIVLEMAVVVAEIRFCEFPEYDTKKDCNSKRTDHELTCGPVDI